MLNSSSHRGLQCVWETWEIPDVNGSQQCGAYTPNDTGTVLTLSSAWEPRERRILKWLTCHRGSSRKQMALKGFNWEFKKTLTGVWAELANWSQWQTGLAAVGCWYHSWPEGAEQGTRSWSPNECCCLKRGCSTGAEARSSRWGLRSKSPTSGHLLMPPTGPARNWRAREPGDAAVGHRSGETRVESGHRGTNGD